MQFILREILLIDGPKWSFQQPLRFSFEIWAGSKKANRKIFQSKISEGSIVMNKGRVFLCCFLQIAAFKKYQSCKYLRQSDILNSLLYLASWEATRELRNKNQPVIENITYLVVVGRGQRSLKNSYYSKDVYALLVTATTNVWDPELIIHQ